MGQRGAPLLSRLEVIRADLEQIRANLKISPGKPENEDLFLEITLILCEKREFLSEDLFLRTHYTFENILF